VRSRTRSASSRQALRRRPAPSASRQRGSAVAGVPDLRVGRRVLPGAERPELRVGLERRRAPLTSRLGSKRASESNGARSQGLGHRLARRDDGKGIRRLVAGGGPRVQAFPPLGR
jgi:hypothetical protein